MDTSKDNFKYFRKLVLSQKETRQRFFEPQFNHYNKFFSFILLVVELQNAQIDIRPLRVI